MLLVEIAITNSTDSTNHQMNEPPRNQFSNAVRSTVPRPILIMMRPTNCQRVAVLEETDVMPPTSHGFWMEGNTVATDGGPHAQP